MGDFRAVGATDFTSCSVAEIRAIARRNSRSGLEADAQSVGKAATDHSRSVAELDRDTNALKRKWSGEAAESAFTTIGRFITSSYLADRESATTTGKLTGLSSAAGNTNEKFSDLKDPPAGMSQQAVLLVRSEIAAELARVYTSPVQADASTMPLGAEVAKVSFDFRPWERAENRSADQSTEEEDGPSGGGGDGSGGGDSGDGSGATTAETDPAGTVDTGATEATGETSDEAGTDAGSGQGAGGTGTGTGTGSGGGGSEAGTDPSAGAGDDTTSDAPAAYDPTTDTEQPSLLSPAATVPVGAGGRSPGGGLSGVRGGAGQVASPLGLRQDTAVARSTPTPIGTGTTTTTGARPSGPYGMPAAGAGAQRGQGDGRHRLPAYLIDRKNGEELVGDLPLVGPGVIGQWKSDGPPDAPRPAAPPARAESRPR